jgi:alpha-L-rhamnosidase
VIWGRSLPEILRLMNVPKDFEYGGGRTGAELAWLHRRAGDTDIYYVANLTDEWQDMEIRVRVANREAELWRPDTGAIERASHKSEGDRTLVRLRFEPRETVFLVLPRAASTASRTVEAPTQTTVATIDGAWRVSFPASLGAPPAITLPALQSWTKHGDEGVRYFSGTATYTKSVDAPREWLRAGARTLLDLGRVADMAEVTVNGKPFDLLWKPPYRVDVTGALRAGRNEIAIKVTNGWTNRIMGDRIAPPERRILSPVTGGRGGGPAEPPESGLLGPVTIARGQVLNP